MCLFPGAVHLIEHGMLQSSDSSVVSKSRRVKSMTRRAIKARASTKVRQCMNISSGEYVYIFIYRIRHCTFGAHYSVYFPSSILLFFCRYQI